MPLTNRSLPSLLLVGLLALGLSGCGGNTASQKTLVREHAVAGNAISDWVTGASLPPDGTLVLLEADRGVGTSPVITRMVDVLVSSLKGSPYSVTRVPVLLEGSRLYEDIWAGPFPAEVEAAVADSGGNVVAVISFMGPPRGKTELDAPIRILSLCGTGEQAERALALGHTHAAVADIRTPGLPPSQRNYQVMD